MKRLPISPDRVRALLGVRQPPSEPAKRAKRSPVGRAPGSRKRWFKPRIPAGTVEAIRRERAAGVPVLTVAAKFGVSGAYVSLVHNERRRKPQNP